MKAVLSCGDEAEELNDDIQLLCVTVDASDAGVLKASGIRLNADQVDKDGGEFSSLGSEDYANAEIFGKVISIGFTRSGDTGTLNIANKDFPTERQ